jgi:transposase InsO family protein
VFTIARNPHFCVTQQRSLHSTRGSSRAFGVTREHTRTEVFEYIEVFYNRQRAHSLLNYETPDAFEICFEKENAA